MGTIATVIILPWAGGSTTFEYLWSGYSSANVDSNFSICSLHFQPRWTSNHSDSLFKNMSKKGDCPTSYIIIFPIEINKNWGIQVSSIFGLLLRGSRLCWPGSCALVAPSTRSPPASCQSSTSGTGRPDRFLVANHIFLCYKHMGLGQYLVEKAPSRKIEFEY